MQGKVNNPHQGAGSAESPAIPRDKLGWSCADSMRKAKGPFEIAGSYNTEFYEYTPPTWKDLLPYLLKRSKFYFFASLSLIKSTLYFAFYSFIFLLSLPKKLLSGYNSSLRDKFIN